MKKIMASMFMLSVFFYACDGWQATVETDLLAAAFNEQCKQKASSCDGNIIHVCKGAYTEGKLVYAFDEPIDCTATGKTCSDTASGPVCL